jgi:hypothetical protein
MGKTSLLAVLLVLVVALAVGINVKIISDKKDRIDIQLIRDREQDEHIKALEKEVRILKTDMYILQYGYEGEKNDS